MKKCCLYVIYTLIMSTSMLYSMGVRQIAYADTTATWARPGMEFGINIGQWQGCSVGYPATDDLGSHYFITVGHCFRSNDLRRHFTKSAQDSSGIFVYSPDNLGSPIGYEKIWFTPVDDSYIDISLVELFPGAQLNGLGRQIPNRLQDGKKGDEACLAALNHANPVCGTITDVSQDEHPLAFSSYIEHDLSGASFCAKAGDSGGAVYNSTGALGIEITGDHRCSAWFLPMTIVLQVLKQQIPSLTI